MLDRNMLRRSCHACLQADTCQQRAAVAHQSLSLPVHQLNTARCIWLQDSGHCVGASGDALRLPFFCMYLAWLPVHPPPPFSRLLLVVAVLPHRQPSSLRDPIGSPPASLLADPGYVPVALPAPQQALAATPLPMVCLLCTQLPFACSSASCPLPAPQPALVATPLPVVCLLCTQLPFACSAASCPLPESAASHTCLNVSVPFC